MNTVDQMWAAVLAAPGDDTAKLALADAYADAGLDAMAHTVRWCVARKKWPRVTPAGRRVTWARAGVFSRPENQAGHELHPLVYHSMGGWSSAVIRYESVRGAVMVLALGLHALRDHFEVPK